MSEPVKSTEGIDTADITNKAYVNGAADFRIRVADLLDDVTVAAPVSEPALRVTPFDHAQPVHEHTEKPDAAALDSAVADRPPALNAFLTTPPAFAPAAPTPAETDRQNDRARLPGEPLVWAPRRSGGANAADLPPFLQQPTPAADAAPAAGVDEVALPAPALERPSPPVLEPRPSPPAISEPVREDSDQTASTNQMLNIRGRSDGVAIEVGRGAWSEVLAALSERLGQSASFFRNSSVALDLGARPVVEDEFQQIADVLTAHEMKLGVVRTSSERAFQAALAVGLTVMLESAEGATVAAAATATSNVAGRGTDDASYFVYKGYLRSGHRLRRRESILVIGDINPGAEVISDGDVLVWGRLRGIVHAGAAGNRRALVAALDLEPTQMRIADVTTIGPDPRPGQPGRFFWRRAQHKRPEIARIVQQDIVIEEWDASRPGGFVSLRRGAG